MLLHTWWTVDLLLQKIISPKNWNIWSSWTKITHFFLFSKCSNCFSAIPKIVQSCFKEFRWLRCECTFEMLQRELQNKEKRSKDSKQRVLAFPRDFYLEAKTNRSVIQRWRKAQINITPSVNINFFRYEKTCFCSIYNKSLTTQSKVSRNLQKSMLNKVSRIKLNRLKSI